MRKFFCFIALLLLNVFSPCVFAQTEAEVPLDTERIQLTILEVERTQTVIVPTQGHARVLIFSPEIVEVSSASETSVVFRGLRLGSSLVHLFDNSGRRTFRIQVIELRSLLAEVKHNREEYLARELGVAQRTLKLDYHAREQHLERGTNLSLSGPTSEINRVRTHDVSGTMEVPWGRLTGDLKLETRREVDLGKEVTQPRNMDLQLQKVDAGPLGKLDFIAGDTNLLLSEYTVDNKRYRGFGFFPSADETKEPKHQGNVRLSMFAGEERLGFLEDLPAGFQKIPERSNFAGTKLGYDVLDNSTAYVTGLHRYGDGGENRADNVYEVGMDWAWQEFMSAQAMMARNGTEGASQIFTETRPVEWLWFQNKFWNVGKRYKTVTGQVARDGQTGWEDNATLRPSGWEDLLTVTYDMSIFKDRNNLNPADPNALNTFYGIGTRSLFPWGTYLTTRASYEDQSGSSFPFVSKKYDLDLNHTLQTDFWFLKSITPLLAFRYEDFGKSNNVPGFDATLELFRAGTRFSFGQGLFAGVTWSKAVLHESNPETFPETSRPRELAIEGGKSFLFQEPHISADILLRYEDVKNTFRKTHQPFPDRNQLTGSFRLSWHPEKDRELFTVFTATTQHPETRAGPTVVDLFGLIGVRLSWDTGFSFTGKGAVTGYLFKDLNFDGKREPEEPGIPGVRIEAVGGPSTVTDRNGHYHLRGVKEGLQTIRADLTQIPSGYFFTTTNATEQLIGPGKISTVDFGVAVEVQFRGKVFNDVDGDLAFTDRVDLPIARVRVSLENGQSSVTEGDGNYLINKVSQGPHTLSLEITSLPDGYQTLMPIQKEVETREGDVIEYNVALKALRSVSGSVFADANGTGIRDRDEKGMEGIRLEMDSTETAVSNAEGHYRFENLSLGQHFIKIDTSNLPNGYHLASPEIQEIDVPTGPFAQEHLDFALLPPGVEPAKHPEFSTLPAPEKETTTPPSIPRRDRETEYLRESTAQIRGVIQELVPSEYKIQVVDCALAKVYGELIVLSEMHPGVRIDSSGGLEDEIDVAIKLISDSVYRVDYYYRSPERASWFREVAETALIEAQMIEAPAFHNPFRQLLSNLSGLPPEELAARVDMDLLESQLREIVMFRKMRGETFQEKCPPAERR